MSVRNCLDGVLYLRTDNQEENGKNSSPTYLWEDMYCLCTFSSNGEGNNYTGTFSAYRKQKPGLPSKRNRERSPCFEIRMESIGEAISKRLKFNLADLSIILRNSSMRETPFFFTISIPGEKAYQLAAALEENRDEWMQFLNKISKGDFISESQFSKFGQQTYLEEHYPKPKKLLPGSPLESPMRKGQQLSYRKEDSATDSPAIGKSANKRNTKGQKKSIDKRLQSLGDGAVVQHRGGPSVSIRTPPPPPPPPPPLPASEPVSKNGIKRSKSKRFSSIFMGGNTNAVSSDTKTMESLFELEKQAEEMDDKLSFCGRDKRFLGIKLETLFSFIKVITAFPFVIVVSSLGLSKQHTFLRSVTGIRVMNTSIYAAPIIFVRFVLSQYFNATLQSSAIFSYLFLYLFPVGYVVFTKLGMSSSVRRIEEGTFCFKPSMSVRANQANAYAIFGFVLEWIQHVLYVFPRGIISGENAAKLSDYPPGLPFEFYFWGTVTCTALCGLILVLNASLRGKFAYRFENSFSVWFFLYNVGSPMFVSFVTILFMALWCDFSLPVPTLIQNPDIVCYGEKHTTMACFALITLAVYIIQHTLLPAATFKETMRDDDLDIMFVPVYLQAHFLLKTIFCGIYVIFYRYNIVRAVILTAINISLLALNTFMKPCSVPWINTLRDAFFAHATLSGIQALNYLAWPVNLSTKDMVVSTLLSNIVFSSIGMAVYYSFTARSPEYRISTAFLDLEWQVSKGGDVHPRVLEPLISLTLSKKEADQIIAKKYIGQLIWLISYPNVRVQFQSAWGLANLALLDEDARMKIHSAGGTKTLFEWYMDMDIMVQLESLAAIANLTLSTEICDEMVVRYKCIPFFIELVLSNKLKHAQFACIALANVAYKESYRELIRQSGGMVALVGCILSHDYQKRRHGCRALANIALSVHVCTEMEQVFENKGLLDKVLKMAIRAEIQTQREVMSLIRNLFCFASLRPLLIERGLYKALERSKNSVFPQVDKWCEEIEEILAAEGDKQEAGLTRPLKGKKALDFVALPLSSPPPHSGTGQDAGNNSSEMQPLRGQVEWSTWGSKLESIFQPIFSIVPSIANSKINVRVNSSVRIHLPNGLTTSALQKIRDSLAYNVLEKPLHGTLNEYSTSKDYLTYTPEKDYVGSDFFVYRAQIGMISSNPASVAIIVESSGDNEDSNTFDDFVDVELAEETKEPSPSPGPGRKRRPSLTPQSSTASPFMTNLMRRTTLRSSFVLREDNL